MKGARVSARRRWLFFWVWRRAGASLAAIRRPSTDSPAPFELHTCSAGTSTHATSGRARACATPSSSAAPSTVTRLSDMKVEPYVIAADVINLPALDPVLNRPANVAPLVESWEASETPGELIFLADPADDPTAVALPRGAARGRGPGAAFGEPG